MKSIRFSPVTALWLALSVLLAATSGAAPARKLVYVGWDLCPLTSEDVHRNRGRFAATGIDGVAMPLTGRTTDGKRISGMSFLSDAVWEESYFSAAVPLIREAVGCEGLRESLAMTLWTVKPEKRLAWKDDAAWSRLEAKMSVLARVVKAAGLKGIVVDHEDYNGGRQFAVIPEDPPAEECAALARRRGRQVFEAFFREMPEASVLAFWMFSEVITRYAMCSPDPRAVLVAKGNLWPQFLNGMLEAMPPGARMIDGIETHGYRAEAETDDFRRWGWDSIRGGERLVAPELRGRYRSCLSVSFGQYLDKYVNPENSRYYFGPKNGSRLAHLAENLDGALRSADDLVWIYGERGMIVDWDCHHHAHLRQQCWEERLPGLYRLFRVLTGKSDPDAAKLKDLLPNSGCDASGGGIPAPFRTWTDQKNPPAGLFAHDPAVGASKPGSLRVSGKGCFTAFVKDLGCGDIVTVSLMAKGDHPVVNVACCKNNAWQWELQQNYLVPQSEPTPDGWQKLEVSLVVPSGADGIGIIMGADVSSKGPVWFDDIQVRR